MKREEQLKYCRVCQHRQFDASTGIICKLTNETAAFEATCNSYKEDSELKIQEQLRLNENKLFTNIASKEKRFVNSLIDTLCYYIIVVIFGILLGITFAILAPQYLYVFDENHPGLEYLVAFCIYSFYYITMETLTGRTVGKLITKTKVVDSNGNIPSFKAILIRTLCRFIPFDAFSYLGNDSSGWHDKFSKTMVVKV